MSPLAITALFLAQVIVILFAPLYGSFTLSKSVNPEFKLVSLARRSRFCIRVARKEQIAEGLVL